MLAKNYRLNKKEVDRLYKKGIMIRGTGLALRTLPNRANHARFAIIIGKKTVPLSTGRNDLRRKIYQTIEDKGKTEFASYDIGIYLRNPKFEEITPELLLTLKKAGIMKEVHKVES